MLNFLVNVKLLNDQSANKNIRTVSPYTYQIKKKYYVFLIKNLKSIKRELI